MKKQFFSFFCLFFILSLPLCASRSKPFKSQEDADAYLTEHYNKGCDYYNRKEWSRASKEFEKVIYWLPCSDEAAKASYYLAVSYFEMKEYDFANEEFSNYLKASQHPEFFEDAVYYKYCIAEHFKAGKKKRPFKMRYLPKWVSGQDSALVIYDEVIAALPNHELTIQALQSKAELLYSMGEYRECIDAYQLLIRRFPKSELVPTCYLKIADAYYQQSRYEFQNPDILALAELNVRKFRDDFPRDERVELAEETVAEIKELYAKGLCDLGLFYQRMEKPEAAAIYFQSSIEEFPDTRVARFCKCRLDSLGYGQEAEGQESSEGNSPEAVLQPIPETPSEPVYMEMSPTSETTPQSIETSDGQPEGRLQFPSEPPYELPVQQHDPTPQPETYYQPYYGPQQTKVSDSQETSTAHGSSNPQRIESNMGETAVQPNNVRQSPYRQYPRNVPSTQSPSEPIMDDDSAADANYLYPHYSLSKRRKQNVAPQE